MNLLLILLATIVVSAYSYKCPDGTVIHCEVILSGIAVLVRDAPKNTMTMVEIPIVAKVKVGASIIMSFVRVMRIVVADSDVKVYDAKIMMIKEIKWINVVKCKYF